MTVFGGFITGGTVSTDPDDATKLTFSGIVINGALGAVAGDTFSAGGYQVPIASVDGTGAATLVYAFPVALEDDGSYAIIRDSAERYNPAATNLLVRQYLAKIADASITYVVPDDGDGPTELIAPDPQEGQKAIRFSNPWKTWLYTEGAWVEQPGSPGGPGATIVTQNTEPATDYPPNSIWIDSDSVDLDVYELAGIPPAWVDTGINLKGATGAAAWLPPVAWATATNYVVGPPASAVVQGGETYVCLVAHTSGTFATDLAADKWVKVAAKGADGNGAGDVVGPATSVAGNIPVFSSTTGKAIQDSGKAPGDFVEPGDLESAAFESASSFATSAQGTKADSAVQSIVQGTGVIIDDTDPQNPIINTSAEAALNRIINPSGQISQTSLASTADGAYTGFDQWLALTQSGAVMPSSVTNAENGTPFMMRLTQVQSTAQRFGLIQPIESANVIDLRGSDVTLSARVRMSTATMLRYAIVEWTGTADTITKDVVADWTNGTLTVGNFFNSSNLTITATGSVSLSANTLASIGLTGAVSGSMNNLLVFFWTDNTQAQNVTLDIGKVQLEAGSSATSLALRSASEELSLCQRYYETMGVHRVYTYSSGTWGSGPIIFRKKKRTTPTVSAVSITYANCSALTFTSIDTDGSDLTVAITSSGGAWYQFGWISDARL